jgi:hypothetical protein
MQVDESANAEETKGFMPIAELQALEKKVKHSLDWDKEEREPLRQVNELVGTLTARASGGTDVVLDGEQETFVYGTLMATLGKYVPAAKTVDAAYATLVAETLQGLVSLLGAELKAQTKTCERLCDVLGPIFNPAAKFYQEHFKEEIPPDKPAPTAPKTEEPAELLQLSEEEIAWRNGLQRGAEVDVVKHDLVNSLEMWVKGVIVTVPGAATSHLGDERHGPNSFLIKFQKDISVQAALFRADSPKIAPLNSKTTGDDWRDNLRVGDQVDALDASLRWNNATILSVDKNKGVMPQVKVGHRVYSAAGDKVDGEGQAYTGWGPGLDECIGSHTLRLQKFGTMTARADEPGDGIEKAIRVRPVASAAGTSTASQGDTERLQDQRDMAMLTEEGQIIYAALRPTCKSALFVQMLNTFGANGGFDDMLRVIESPETSLDLVCNLTAVLANSARMYHKSFVSSFFARLSEAVEHKLINAPEAQLRAVRQDAVAKAVDYVWKDILGRLLAEDLLRETRGRLQVKLGVMLLQEKFGLAKRLEGARMIEAVCKKGNTTRNQYGMVENKDVDEKKDESLDELVRMLGAADVVDLFFSKRTIHGELIRRSENMLKLLLTQEAITDEQL